ncbi:hypothetical protein AGMMS50230_06940 [Spirochaetia bacterium]|nr:hypothetical protein AGMMS50230_06940 [Spirochaetia bacterium]
MDFPAEGEYNSSSAEETAHIAENLAARLGPGSIVTLTGRLGAGKTVFAAGFARALGISEQVTSPSYTIISEYEAVSGFTGSIPFYHMDCYRLSGDDDFRLAGGEDLLYGKGICLIEWPERLCLLPETVFAVTIDIMEDSRRKIRYQDRRHV